jgi:histidinol-phosphate aminotransferase
MMIRSRQSVREIKEYVPGKNVEEVAASYGIDERSIVKLASNENCLGPSPRAVEAIRDAACDVHVYPSVDAFELREALARRFAVPVKNIVCGAGMDGVLETLLRAYLDPGDESIIPLPAFSYYEIVTRFCGATPVFCDRRDDFTLDVDAVLEKVTGRTKFIFITSPNNPTGNLTPVEDIRKIAAAVDAIVFVDEGRSPAAPGTRPRQSPRETFPGGPCRWRPCRGRCQKSGSLGRPGASTPPSIP